MGLWKEGFKEKGQGNSIGDGFYANHIVINRATDISGEEYELPNGTTLFATDLAVLLKFTDLSRDKEFSMRIAGNFARDKQTGEIKQDSSGTAFKIELLFEKAGYSDPILNEDNSIKEEALKALTDKELVLIAYPDKRGKTCLHDMVGKVGESEDMKTQFLVYHARTGYPKNYQPKNEVNGLPVPKPPKSYEQALEKELTNDLPF